MNPLLAVILVCAAAVAQPDCARDTALDVRVVGPAPTPFACLSGAMQTLAREGEAGPGLYAVIRCERRR